MASTVFKDGQVFRDGGFDSADVLIEEKRIVSVGSDLIGEETVDTTDHVLLPGLFDTHIHMAFPGMDLFDLGRSLAEGPEASSFVSPKPPVGRSPSASRRCAMPAEPDTATSRRSTGAMSSAPGCRPP